LINVKRILENQKEVKYLTYFISQHQDNSVKVEIGTISVNRNYKFKSPEHFLSKIVDILFDLKDAEKKALDRLEREIKKPKRFIRR
jgi:hypothetical protein